MLWRNINCVHLLMFVTVIYLNIILYVHPLHKLHEHNKRNTEMNTLIVLRYVCIYICKYACVFV